jgi:hypothetical protein
MVLTLKHRIRYYRRFRTDIWGLKLLSYTSNLKKFKRITKIFLKWYIERQLRRKQMFQRFIYRIDVVRPRRKYRYIKKRFLTLRIVKLFYLTLTYKNFNKIAFIASKKDGSFANHFFLALEGRLICFLYRTTFVSNMFESLRYVKSSFVTLNKKIFNFVNQPVSLFVILSFHPSIKKKVYYDFCRRIVFEKRSLFNPPNYLFVSYWFLFAFMLKMPLERNFVKTTKSLDYFRATGFAF